MKSPFAIFRKNQRLGMALLTIMAMFAFVFLGNAGPRSGVGRGGAADVVVHTNAGNVDQILLQDMIRSRNVCNMFMQRAVGAAFAGNERELGKRLAAANFGPATRQNMVFSYLLRQEAHRLGIVVSDHAIEAFIDRITEGGKFSSSAFNEILAENHWNSRELYDALRGELEANMAFRIESPREPQTPDQYWDFYRQLKITANVQVAAVPVKEFLSKVPDPSEKELKEYFEANKNRWPGMPPDFKPGFKQPRRVELQYLTASYEAVEQLVPEVTDKDVEAYYEEHKDALFLEPITPKRGSENGPIEPEFAPENPEAAPKEGDSEKPADKPADEKPADADKKPAEPKDQKPEAAPKDEPVPGEKQPEKKAEDEPKGARRQVLKSTELLAYADDAEKAAKAQEPQPTATDADPAKTKPAAAETTDKPADDKPEAAEKPTEAKPADKDEKPAEGAEKPATERKPETEVEEQPREKKYRPLNDSLKETIRARILDQRTQVAMDELADQASEAMTQLSLKYNNLAMKSARGGWELYADLNGNDQLDEGEPSVFVKQKPNLESLDPVQYRLLRAAVSKVAASDLAAEAKKLQTSFGETGLVTAMQLREQPQIGIAEEMSDDPMRGAANVLQLAYSDETLYRALRLRNPDTRNLIVAWKCQDVPARIPTYADPGVKEEVLNVWKTQHAQPLAEKRAEELAKLVNEQDGESASKALHDQTVTGEKDATSVTVSSPEAFTWMRESAAPGFNPWASPPPQMSDITFVDNPGTRFMRLVFDELKEGQAGVAPNENRSIYYVVKLERRNPGTKEGIAAMRETFATTPLFPMLILPDYPPIPTPYSKMAQQQQQEAIFEWRRGLEKRYDVVWTNPSDEIGDRE
jgi:hypothetical protein